MVLRAKEDVVDPHLFPFLFHSKIFIDTAITISVGGLSPTINWKDIAKQKFLLPPKAEQQRLAELLWAADDVVEKEKVELEKLIVYRMNWFDRCSLNQKSNTKLSNCLIVKKEKSKVPHKKEKYIGLEHIESGKRTTKLYGDSKEVLADSYVFKEGDLLYSKLRPYLDKCIIANFDGICTTELIVYNTTDITSKEYILNILHSQSFLNYITDKGFGTKMPRVSHSIVSEYEFFLPTIQNQEIILDKLKILNGQQNVIEQQIALSQQMKQELINKIF